MNATGTSISWLSLGINLVLGSLKCAVGLVAQSQALIADGFHSLVDMSTDLAALFGLRMAAKPQDGNHPYGHHKFASLSTLFIAVILLAFCLGLAITAVRELIAGVNTVPGPLALVVALLSLIVKEWLFWATRRVARREKSRLVMINAWHHRTDSLSSLLVCVALVAVTLGGPSWAVLDKGLALLLAGWLGFEGLKMFFQACNDLLDAAPEAALINDLREHILPTPGVVAYHQFRARRVGDMIEVDLHLQVKSTLTVEEGHAIAKQVKANILARHPEVIDVLIHLEPADPEHLREEGISDFSV
jgi:cation diffusion facilitator family transporter